MKSFFLNLKMERVRQTHYADHTDAVKDISQYNVAFNNGCKLHLSLVLSFAQLVRGKVDRKPTNHVD